MGREGKVASPALRGNANPRLLRHKLSYTTLSKHLNTLSSQNCIPAGRRRGLWSRADSPPRPSPGSPAGAPSGPTGRDRPRRLPGRGQGERIATRWSWWSQPAAARASRREGAPAAHGGAPGDRAPDVRAQTGRHPPPGHPPGDEGLLDGYEPPADRLHFTHRGRLTRPGGPSRRRERAGAAVRRWPPRRRPGRVRP